MCAPDGYGTKLEKIAASVSGEIPKWRQAGNFILDHKGTAVRIELDGLFGTAASMIAACFRAYAIDLRKPFISDTGFRSFAGYGYSEFIPGLTPEDFVHQMLPDHIENELGGELVKEKPK